MISQFIEEFRGTSSAEMQEFKSVLTQLAKNLEAAGTKIGADLGAAGTSFGSAAGNLETVITKTQQTVEQLDSSLQRAGSVVSEGSDRFEIISDKLFTNLRAVDGLLVGVDSFLDKIQKISAHSTIFQTRLTTQLRLRNQFLLSFVMRYQNCQRPFQMRF